MGEVGCEVETEEEERGEGYGMMHCSVAGGMGDNTKAHVLHACGAGE